MKNNTIYLSKKEQAELKVNKVLLVERNCYIPAPKSSIIHGTGFGRLFDKIDYRWVYGNVDDYIKVKTNVGRREIDYKDNRPNTTNGGLWWSNKGYEDEFGTLGDVHENGVKHRIRFRVTDINITELHPKGEYLNIILTIRIELF